MMTNGMVVAPQPEAVETGLDILRDGGNVVDAAIGAAFGAVSVLGLAIGNVTNLRSI